MTERTKQHCWDESDKHPETSLEDLGRLQFDKTLDSLVANERRYSRRGFLGIAARATAITGIGLGVGGEALRLDTRIGEVLNPSTSLTIEHIAPAVSLENDYHDTLLIPGFNVYSARPAAEAIQGVLSQHGGVSALHHASDRFSMDGLVDATRRHINEHSLTSLTLLGSSLGGMIAVELADRVKEVKLVIADSSPADPSDAFGLPEGFLKAVIDSASWVVVLALVRLLSLLSGSMMVIKAPFAASRRHLIKTIQSRVRILSYLIFLPTS
jgi:pimeloyl-ACP methyl ester carboxylesterase